MHHTPLMNLDKISTPQEWEYFAKGGANILFKYTGTNDILSSKLLRLRIAKPEFIPTIELFQFLEIKCKPIFQDLLIDCELINVSREFIEQLNSPVEIAESCGLILPNILYGDFITLDLSKWCQLHYSEQQVILEIKPKWIYQCHTNYCRTCSLSQLRGHTRHFCPLDLVNDPDSLICDLFSRVDAGVLQMIEKVVPVRTLLKEYLSHEDNIFQHLLKLQEVKEDQDRIECLTCAEDVSERLSFIMTLRDVGVFLKFQQDTTTCKIYDLDLKSSEKFSHWVKTEQKLNKYYNSINENWKYCKR